MSDSSRVPGMGLTPAEQVEVAAIEARWRKIEATPEFREMRADLERRIAASSSGEVGTLSVDDRRAEQAARDAARSRVSAPSGDASTEASRLAQQTTHSVRARL